MIENAFFEARLTEVSSIENSVMPGLRTIKGIFTDFKPNRNNKGIPLVEAENIIRTASHMPIKVNMFRGAPAGHTGARPVGFITKVWHDETAENMPFEGFIWEDEAPDFVDYVESSVDENEPVLFSWEIRPTKGRYDIDSSGVAWLRDCQVVAHTVVNKPAYGNRVALTAFAEEQGLATPNYRYTDYEASAQSCGTCVFWENVDRYGGDGSVSHQAFCRKFEVGIDVMADAVCDAWTGSEDDVNLSERNIPARNFKLTASAHVEALVDNEPLQEINVMDEEIQDTPTEPNVAPAVDPVESELDRLNSEMEALRNENATYKRKETLSHLRSVVKSELNFQPDTSEEVDAFLLSLPEDQFATMLNLFRSYGSSLTPAPKETPIEPDKSEEEPINPPEPPIQKPERKNLTQSIKSVLN